MASSSEDPAFGEQGFGNPGREWEGDDWLLGRAPFDDTGFAPFDDTDTPAEVDAVWRLQRRIALSYFVLFVVVTFGTGFVIVRLSWAADNTIFGGFSPAFLLTGFALYLFFVIVAGAAASLSNSIEDQMMGSGSGPTGDTGDGPVRRFFRP